MEISFLKPKISCHWILNLKSVYYVPRIEECHPRYLEFFNDGGSVVLSFGECLVYDVRFKNNNNLPKFSKQFVKILRELYATSMKSLKQQRLMFNRFRHIFGDFFFSHVQLGMQFSHARSMKPSKTMLVSRKEIKSCNHRKLAHSIKTSVSKRYAETKCTWRAKQMSGAY